MNFVSRGFIWRLRHNTANQHDDEIGGSAVISYVNITVLMIWECHAFPLPEFQATTGKGE